MKRILFFFFLLLMIIYLTACAQAAVPAPSAIPEPTPTALPFVIEPLIPEPNDETNPPINPPEYEASGGAFSEAAQAPAKEAYLRSLYEMYKMMIGPTYFYTEDTLTAQQVFERDIQIFASEQNLQVFQNESPDKTQVVSFATRDNGDGTQSMWRYAAPGGAFTARPDIPSTEDSGLVEVVVDGKIGGGWGEDGNHYVFRLNGDGKAVAWFDTVESTVGNNVWRETAHAAEVRVLAEQERMREEVKANIEKFMNVPEEEMRSYIEANYFWASGMTTEAMAPPCVEKNDDGGCERIDVDPVNLYLVDVRQGSVADHDQLQGIYLGSSEIRSSEEADPGKYKIGYFGMVLPGGERIVRPYFLGRVKDKLKQDEKMIVFAENVFETIDNYGIRGVGVRDVSVTSGPESMISVEEIVEKMVGDEGKIYTWRLTNFKGDTEFVVRSAGDEVVSNVLKKKISDIYSDWYDPEHEFVMGIYDLISQNKLVEVDQMLTECEDDYLRVLEVNETDLREILKIPYVMNLVHSMVDVPLW